MYLQFFFGLATDECSEVSHDTSEIEILDERMKKKTLLTKDYSGTK